MEWLEREYLDVALGRWLAAAGVALAVWLCLLVVRQVVLRRLALVAQRTRNRWDDLVIGALRGTKALFLLLFALAAGAVVLELSGPARAIVSAVAKVALVVQAGLWISAALRAWAEGFRQQRLESDPAGVTSMLAVALLAQIALWVLVGLLVLANSGVEVAPLIAGLGVGGIAVALALQSILADLFASLSILLDKPFVVGDFLGVGELLGRVEHIGLKTTRLRSLSGEQLVVGNGDLLRTRIRNFGRMFERRVAFVVGVLPTTPREQLTRIPALVREIIAANGQARFERCHFKQIAGPSLEFETVYYVRGADFLLYMDIQQRINLEVLARFEDEGIPLAFPARALQVESVTSTPPGSLPGQDPARVP